MSRQSYIPALVIATSEFFHKFQGYVAGAKLARRLQRFFALF
jgi:hypothetical protein